MRFRRFILLVQMKEMISMSYGSSIRCWKPWRWVRFGMILTMRDIYMMAVTQSHNGSSRKTYIDILRWNISQMITKTIRISTRNVISYAMKPSILFWVYWKVNGNWESNIIRIFRWRESHSRTNPCVKRAGLWESQSEIWVGMLTIWVRSTEIEKLS